jgi:glycosyltransferase involved in cell wall biosynthesis
MRVLHVITALGLGGAERMLLKLLGARALSHCEQQVVAMLPGGPMANTMRAAGATVLELDFLGGLPLAGGTRGLVKAARSFRPDVVQGWLYHGNLGAAIVRAFVRPNVPLVWGIRQSLASLENENAFAKAGIVLNRLASGYPDRLLFNSRTSLAQHREFGFRMNRADYLPNGFEADDFRANPAARAQCRSEWGVDAGAVVFGLFARFHPFKDHAGFFEAGKRLLAERPASRFVLAGTGIHSGNPALMAAIRSAGLDAHVHLLGERSDVPAVLSGLDVYVSSSAAEAFSNSIGEAMSCEVPCVVTDVGDSSAIVGSTGRVVPRRDPAALAAAMIQMHDLGPAGRSALGREARRRILDEFDIEAVAARYSDLYASLVDGAREAA